MTVPQLTKARKVVKTCCLISVWICIGMNLEITGPTLIDLKLITNTTYEDVARAASGRGFGFFTGALIGGFLVEKLNAYCDTMIAVCLILMGVFGICIPHLGVSFMFVVILLQGVTEGVVNIAGQKLLLEIWQEQAASPMHSLHLGFGIGSLIVPQIAEPFLAAPLYQDQNINTNNTQNMSLENIPRSLNTSTWNFTYTLLNETSISPTDVSSDFVISHVKWAYLIVAFLAFVVSFIFFIFQFCGKSFRHMNSSGDSSSVPRPSVRTIIDPGTCTGGDRVYGVNMFVLLFLFCFQAFGGEYICSNFLRSYAIDTFHMQGAEASWLNTCFWISYTIGCFLGFMAAWWIPIRSLLLVESTGLFIATLLAVVLAGKTSTLLWVFIQPIGAFIAPGFPVCLVWGDYHVEMTGFALTFVLFGGSLGGVTYLWVAGHIYDSFGPGSFLYMCVFCGGALCLISLLMHFTSWNKGSRFTQCDTTTCGEEHGDRDDSYLNIDEHK